MPPYSDPVATGEGKVTIEIQSSVQERQHDISACLPWKSWQLEKLKSDSKMDEASVVPARNTTERHRLHSGVLRDFIIGFADGLTVPFALTAGLSSYVIADMKYI